MLNVGIIGCGRIGQVHACSLMLMDRAFPGSVTDAVTESAERLAAQTGAHVTTIEKMLADPNIDAVVIGTPTDTHFDLIHAAAAAGKAIFCEKPIDLSSDRIEACLDAVTKAGVPFMTAFNRRFDPNFANISKRLREGEIGEVELVTILSRDPSPPPIEYIKSSGGLFRDMMIHDLDMARFLLNEEPVEIQAMGACLVDPAIGAAGDVDTAAVLLRTESGKICQISNSRRATYGYDQRIEVHGARGMLRAENVLEDHVEVATEAGFRRAPTKHFFLERYEAAYLEEMAHFVDCVLDGTPPCPSGEDGLRAQRLADAATRALQTGQPQKLD